MKLGNKTFLYSMIISLIVGVAIFSYMYFLMPKVYMDYKQKEHFEYAKEAINSLKENGNLNKITKSDDNIIGIVIPKEGNEIAVSGAGFDGKIEIRDGVLSQIIDVVRGAESKDGVDKDRLIDAEAFEKKIEPLLNSAVKEFSGSLDEKFKITLSGKKDQYKFKPKSEKFYRIDKNTIIGEFTVEREETGTEYTTYIGISKKDGVINAIMSTAVTPKATEIMPVVIKALPMLILMMILLSFGVSAVFSRNIVNPIKKLSDDAEKRMSEKPGNFEPIEIIGNDEISDLTRMLNHLYRKQADNFKLLEEENKRKEVFMRASSHQLKTPIAAAMLLTDGMISNVGKFTNRDEYLPKLKEQLKEMMSIVDEIVSINYLANKRELSRVSMNEICEDVMRKNAINADSSGIKLILKKEGDNICYRGIKEMLDKIVSNLVSNGITYTENGGEVILDINNERLIVTNRPGEIDASIIDSIFEPFVTSADNKKSGQKGHGLGLYVAKYFAESMGFTLSVKSEAGEVQFILER